MSDIICNEIDEGIKEYIISNIQKNTVTLKNYKGLIRICSWDRDDVKIVANLKNKNDFVINEEEFLGASKEVYVDIQSDENGVIVSTKTINKDESSSEEDKPANIIETFVKWVGKKITNAVASKVSYDVWVPEGFNVISNNKSGDYIIDDFIGNARLSTANGRYDINDLNGNIEVLTYNGRITASGIKGRLSANTYNGRIVVMESELADMLLKSMNGSITAHFLPEESGHYKMKTMNGRVLIGIPSSVPTAFKCKTMSGNIYNELYQDYQEKVSGSIASMNYGDYGADISVNTMSGSIYLVEYDEFDYNDEGEEDSDTKAEEYKDLNIKIDVDKNSEEYKEIREEVNEALSKIIDDMKDIVLSDGEDNSGSTAPEELSEILNRFNSIKDDFTRIVDGQDFDSMTNEHKNKIHEEINLIYEMKIKNLEKELYEKTAELNHGVRDVDERFNDKINSVKESIEYLNNALKSFIGNEDTNTNTFKNLKTPGRPVGSGKNKSKNDETKMILDMLQQGKISVEEAERLMKALKD